MNHSMNHRIAGSDAKQLRNRIYNLGISAHKDYQVFVVCPPQSLTHAHPGGWRRRDFNEADISRLRTRFLQIAEHGIEGLTPDSAQMRITVLDFTDGDNGKHQLIVMQRLVDAESVAGNKIWDMMAFCHGKTPVLFAEGGATAFDMAVIMAQTDYTALMGAQRLAG